MVVEAAAEPVRCQTPEGSDGDEQLEEGGEADDSPAEEPPPPPRGREYLAQLALAVQGLVAAANQLVGDG